MSSQRALVRCKHTPVKIQAWFADFIFSADKYYATTYLPQGNIRLAQSRYTLNDLWTHLVVVVVIAVHDGTDASI